MMKLSLAPQSSKKQSASQDIFEKIFFGGGEAEVRPGKPLAEIIRKMKKASSENLMREI